MYSIYHFIVNSTGEFFSVHSMICDIIWGGRKILRYEILVTFRKSFAKFREIGTQFRVAKFLIHPS
jgi:hypothetical protein